MEKLFHRFNHTAVEFLMPAFERGQNHFGIVPFHFQVIVLQSSVQDDLFRGDGWFKQQSDLSAEDDEANNDIFVNGASGAKGLVLVYEYYPSDWVDPRSGGFNL